MGVGMIPLDIPAGVVQEASKFRNKTNWRNANLIRWDGDTILPINGWAYTGLTPTASNIRAIHRWMTNVGRMYTAYLCEEHCYVDLGDSFVDITPVDGMTPPPGNNGAYGDDLYNTLKYGTPRPGESRLGNFTPAYTLSNWGDELRFMTSPDGRYLKWDPATPSAKATKVVNSPVGRQFVITPERHAMIFGIEGKNDRWGWSDQEDDTNWTFTDPLNSAGFYDIEPSSPICAVCQFFGGILMFTMQSNYLIRYVGLPYIYSYEEVAKAPAPMNAQCVVETPTGVMWPSIDGYWIHDGNSVQTIPCPLWDNITEMVDFSNTLFYGHVVNVTCRNELWWFYVDRTHDNRKQPTRLVIFEYRRGWWSKGANLYRTAGVCYGNEQIPIMAEGTDVVKHEIGYNYPGSDMPWVETFSLNIGDGEFLGTLKQILPEIVGDNLAIQWRAIKSMARSNVVETVCPPRQPFDGGNGLIDIRETARDIRLRIEMVEPAKWSVGPILIDAVRRGKK